MSGYIGFRRTKKEDHQMRLAFFLLLLGFHSVVVAPGSALSQTAPPPFEAYDLIQFIQTAGPAPQNILGLDNNGELLLATRSGKSSAQLQEAGIVFNESQVQLLKAWRLLEERDNILYAQVPVLDASDAQALRRQTQEAAVRIGRALEEDVVHLVATLNEQGRRKNAYSILFSYVLDGIVWDHFRENNSLSARALSAEEPFWSGEVWAIYPPRAFNSGTNSISDKGVSLKLNWSRPALKKMRPFVENIATLARILDDFIERGYVQDEKAKAVFAPFNLYDETGHLTIPVIEENEHNALYRLSTALSAKIATQALDALNLQVLQEKFALETQEQTLAIAYHELMWDLLDFWDAEGLIEKPIAFENPDRATSKDIADLVFIVRGERQ